ncbi:hypothetical protein EC968_003784 [Mortierella alpina]|nr:hypothetical protein EC968_003784 [Mortierella alpina]
MNTNTNKNSQASQKADRMAGNGQRSRNGREDSTMQSEQNETQPHQSPMRVAASRPDSHEFKVAGEVHGGAMRQKNQPSKSAAITDDKGFVLPLDSAVAKEMVSGRKEQEPINHLHQTLEHNVRVGLNKPSLTVFSSMGGGRNGSSTEIEFGGADSKKDEGNGALKEYEYRDEDFQPLSAQANSKQRVSSSIPKAASSTGQNAPGYSKSSVAKKPMASVGMSQHQQARHRSQDDVSPELNLGTLFQDEKQGGSRVSGKERSALPGGKHAAPTRALPAEPAEPAKQKGKLPQASSRTAAPAPAVAFPSTNLRKEAPDRNQDHTPEMNLGSLFQEDEASTKPRSNQQQQQHQTKAAPRFQRFGVSSGHQDVPEQSSASGSAVVPPYHASYGPNRHVQQAVPIHKSAMPPVHHAAPAHHPAPEYGLTTAHQANERQSAFGAHAHDDPMHHSNTAPVYHAPSASTEPYDRTRTEVIHEPTRSFATGLQTSSVDAHNLHYAVNANATPDSAPAPTHEIPFTKHKPAQVLGKSREEPISQPHVQGNVAHMQTEAAGLNAASYPSFVRHSAKTNQHPAPARSTAKSGRNLDQENRQAHPARPKRMSKRERKAVRKSEAAKHMSVLDSISTALVGRRKNSVSTPVMRLNELFETAEQWAPQTEEHHSSTAVAAGLGGIRSMLGSIHMPTLISRQTSDVNAAHAEGSFKLGAASSHAYGTGSQSRQKSMPSKAAALKAPKINLALYPEEQPDYSRGINIKRENPPPAKLSAHVRNITEIPYHGFSASGYKPRSTVASAGVHRPPLARMILDLHARHAGPFKEQSQSLNASTTARVRSQQTRHSTAAALKKPKLNLWLFPEEEADYPRGEGLHRPNRLATHANLVEVKEIQLDSAHRHAHHDLHPTIAETATTAVNQGIAGLKSMWGSMHAPSSVSSEGGALNNPAAAAVLSTMAAAAMHHIPSAPEVHRAPNNLHSDVSHEEHHDSAYKSKKPVASNLPLMYGTSVDSASGAHRHAPPIPTKHEQHHATSDAYMASMLQSSAAPATHAAPASTSVYSAEPAAQYHTVAPKIVSVPGQGYTSHRTAVDATAVPLAAATGSIHANSLRQQQHPQQRNHRFIPSEHHARRMEIHATSEDAEERFFPPQYWQSPALRHAPMMSTHGAALKPKNDPALLLARKAAPLSVLPSPSHSRRGIMIAGPVQHDQHHQQRHHQQQPVSSGANSAALPLAATAAAGVGAATASHGLPQHQQQAQKKVPVAKIPIAEPPVQVPVRPAKVPVAQPPATLPSSRQEPGMDAEATAFRSAGSRVPGQHVRSRLSHDSSTSEAALAATPLMAASATAIKPDNVVMMESGGSNLIEHQGDRKYQHHHHQQEPVLGSVSRDAHAPSHDGHSAGSASRVTHQHHTGAAMAGAAAVPILASAPRTAVPAMNTTHSGHSVAGPDGKVVMMKKTTTTTTIPMEDPLATSDPVPAVAPLRAGEPVVIPTQRDGEEVIIQTRTVPKGSEVEQRPLQQQTVPKQQQQQPNMQPHLKEAAIIPTQRPGEDVVVQARTVPADTKSATHSSPHLQESHKPSHHYGIQALGASAATTAAAAAAMPLHHNSFDRSSVEGTKDATHASKPSHRDTRVISNVAAPSAQSIVASSASFDPAANANAGTVKPASIAVHTPASPQRQHAAVQRGVGTAVGAPSAAAIHSTHMPASPQRQHAAVQRGVGTTVGTPSAAAIHSTHFPVPAPRPAAPHPSAAAATTTAAAAAAVPVVAASTLHKDFHGSNHVDAAAVDRQSIDHQPHATTTSVPAAPVVNQTYNRHSTPSGVTPVTASILSQSIQPNARADHVGALDTCPIAHSHDQYDRSGRYIATTTTTTSAPIGAAAADAAVSVRPPGYDGPLPAVNPGEKVMWVKKVRTTQEYYDSDEEGGDELDLDEFGYRRDRDVSLHLPLKTGTHSHPVSRSGSVSGSVGSTEASQPTILQHHQETNADATRRGLAQ